jgi:iron-sulfur cluster repair protein YtfE (RIC family)
MSIPDIHGFIWFLFTAVSAGFIWLLWRLLRDVSDGIVNLREEITKLKDELVKTREHFTDKYRTKDEACRDWAELKENLKDFKKLAERVTLLESRR